MRSFSLFVRLEAVAFGDVPGPALLLRLEEISALHGPSYCQNCSQLPSCRSANLLLLTFQLRYRFRTMLPRALPLGLRNRCTLHSDSATRFEKRSQAADSAWV